MRRVNARVIKSTSVSKSSSSTAIKDDSGSVGDLIYPLYRPVDLIEMSKESTVIPQCIDAYKQNIAGFGFGLQYKEDDTKVDETSEMKAEWERVKDILQFFNFDKPFKDVWAEAIMHREQTGNGYIEIIRDGTGLPAEAENMEPEYVKVSKLGDPVEVTMWRNGKQFKRKKKFRRYLQKINGLKVWFKAFGDPRKMSWKTGQYGEGIPPEEEANEILHLKIGSGAYGEPRWISQSPHMSGSRKAEILNLNYFDQGRHVPMAILVKNGLLTDESVKQLEEYASNLNGVDHAHKWLVLEVEGLDEGITEDEKTKVDIEMKSLADILQGDALFQTYDDNSRMKQQSAFRLPDIFVGRSRDFNRATADKAREITEEQVFQPERESLAFILNNVLLEPYNLQHVEVFFEGPDISDSEDKAKLLTVYNQIGGVSPNDVRDDVGKILGKTVEAFEDEGANIPLSLRQQQTGNTFPIALQKGASPSSEIVHVLKDLRDVLEGMGHGTN
ncbi:phage portal protein [Paenibacillus sp. W2I17]|uniref:phage portal protein n=1 Tax=Paenibacillus sp. W2I17 TaxID=3042311 RepID=UPI00278A90B0|nr:phage portal protein [Paenibacillus sp. W2I17]MDQ0658769.1 PBSX family phage portal protein [Paenibacillus sp. W2I17]